MPVSYNYIPETLRLPLFWAEVDPSLAGSYQNYQRALIIGYKTSAGTQTADTFLRLTGRDQAKARGGAGSQFWAMADAWFKNNSFDESWGAVIAEPTGTKSAGSIATTGPATASGTLYLYIAGRRLSIGIISGDSANTVASSINTAINATTDLPVTSTVSTNTVTVTAKWKGVEGDNIDMRLNYLGSLGGESTPAGVGVTITAMSGGVGVPDLTALIAALGDQEFDTVVMPWTDSATLNAIDAEWDHTGDNGRWSWQRQVYGHVFSARDGSSGSLQTFGAARNGAHVTVFGYYGSPTPLWERAAMFAARAHRSLLNDPARPLHTLELTGMLPAIESLRFDKAEKNAMAFDGISCAKETSDNRCQIETSFTLYQKNVYGLDDDAFLKVQTLATLAYYLRSMRFAITQKFPRHKLGNDGTRYGPGQAICTPNTARAELLAHYRRLEYIGLVENFPAFRDSLIVERHPSNPNRLNVSVGPDLINQLDVFAVLAQFRLQYPASLPDQVLQVA